MFGGFLTMMFIFVMISVILNVTRSGRPRLGDSGYPPQPLDRRPRPQIDQWAGLGGPTYGHTPYRQAPFVQSPYGQSPYAQSPYGGMFGGQPQPYADPAARQPMSQGSRDAIDRDITSFGEELRDLDLEVVGMPLDDATQADYTKALDAYDGAKQQLYGAQTNADVKRIAEIMEEGRYAVACVRARVAGAPVPEHRPPCFFDPSHGVSVANVSWAPHGGAPRDVPACAADAQRVRTGNDPSIRMVYSGQRQVPYWEDQQHAAWAQGYYGRYGGDPALRTITHGALMIGGFSLLMGLLDD